MGLIGKVKAWGTGYAVAIVLKAAANGEYGPAAQWVYWHMREIKTNIGIILGVTAAIIAVLDRFGVCALGLQHWSWFNCTQWTDAIVKVTGSVGAFFVWIGSVDGGLHLQAPIEPVK